MRMTNPLDFLNHFMFAGVLLWFFVQHSLINPLPIKYGPADVTKAMYNQPRTPPPVLDLDQFDSSWEETRYGSFGSYGSLFGSPLGSFTHR